VGLPVAQVVALEQPVEFLAGETDDGPVQVPRPLEALPLQVLVPQTEAVALPVQALDRIASALKAMIVFFPIRILYLKAASAT